MAAIREEYILADKFSASFTRLLSFLDRTSAASKAAAQGQERLERASGGTGTAMVRLSEAALDVAESMGAAGERAEDLSEGATRAAQAQDRANQSMRQGASAASGLEGRILSLAKAYLGLRSAQAFVEMTDTSTLTTARLDRMNDGSQGTEELQEMIYQAAQRSRGVYQETADLVGKLGTMAPEAFNSSQELVAFAEQINKQFALAGTSTQGAQAAMLQLTQAMSSGVLRGEELNSVLEQAPTITQTIAKYLDVNIGQLREMASEGKITADVVKSALFDAADRTNAAFEKVPLTFGQAWTMASNAAVKALGPAMKRLNELLNSELGQKAINGLITGFELLGSVATGAIDLLESGAQWVADNWDLVSTMLQFAAGAFLGLAAASAASALVSAAAWAAANWPLLLIAALIGVVIMAMYAMGMSSEEVFGKIGAVAGGLFAFLYNMVKEGWNRLAAFGEFFASFLDNPVAAIVHLLADLADSALSFLQNIAGAIDAVFGSNLASAVSGWRSGIQSLANSIVGEKKVKIERMAELDIRETADQWSNAAAGMGKALDNFNINDALGKFASSGFDYSAMAGAANTLGAIKDDTSAIKRSVALSEEDMKLLVDMAERQYVNNINLTAQTPIITINGQNTGDTEADLQWLEDSLQRILVEQAASHTDMSYR